MKKFQLLPLVLLALVFNVNTATAQRVSLNSLLQRVTASKNPRFLDNVPGARKLSVFFDFIALRSCRFALMGMLPQFVVALPKTISLEVRELGISDEVTINGPGRSF